LIDRDFWGVCIDFQEVFDCTMIKHIGSFT
jgi:hypothetical protein